ncbi:arylesterase [Marinicella pacifica]|nr:arylesterase [Marinicella pacifica]
MKIIQYGLWMILAMGMTACQESTPPNQPQETTSQTAHSDYVIMALGDSLTEGLGVDENHNYPAILQQQISAEGFKNVQVVNAGLSGETSTGLLNRLDWVMQLEPDLTVLNIGANDAMRGLDLALTEQNIRTIIKKLRNNDSDVILAGMEIYDNLGRDYVSGFKDMYVRIAEDLKVPFIPFFLAGVAGQTEYNQKDGIHPNQAGYRLIVENNILPIVLDHLEKNK